MRILVVHDKRGNISSFGIPGKSAQGQIGLMPPRGKYVTEVEVPEIKKIGAGSEGDHEQVQNILKQSRLDTGGEKPRLVKK